MHALSNPVCRFNLVVCLQPTSLSSVGLKKSGTKRYQCLPNSPLLCRNRPQLIQYPKHQCQADRTSKSLLQELHLTTVLARVLTSRPARLHPQVFQLLLSRPTPHSHSMHRRQLLPRSHHKSQSLTTLQGRRFANIVTRKYGMK